MTEQFDPYRKWLGIPPEEQPPHHYRLLGIGLFESDPDTIDHASNRQMTHVRSFQGGAQTEHSQRLLNELSAARVCLLDPGRKSVYDEWLRSHLNRLSAPATPSTPRSADAPMAAAPPPPASSPGGPAGVRAPMQPAPPHRAAAGPAAPSIAPPPSPQPPSPQPPAPQPPSAGSPSAEPSSTGGGAGVPAGQSKRGGGNGIDVRPGAPTYQLYRRRTNWVLPVTLMATLAAVALVVVLILLGSRNGEHGRGNGSSDSNADALANLPDDLPWYRPDANDTSRRRANNSGDARLVTPTKPAQWSPSGQQHRLGEMLRLTGMDGPIGSIDLVDAGERVVTAGADGTLRAWDVGRGEHVQELSKIKGELRRVKLAPGSDRLAAFTVSKRKPPTIHIFSGAASDDGPLPKQSHTKLPLDDLPPVVDVAFTPTADAAAVACEDGSVHLYDLTTREQQRVMQTGANRVTVVAISPIDDTVAVAADDEVILFSRQTGNELRRLRGHQGNIGSMAFSRNGKQLITGCEDTRARVWDVATGQLGAEFQLHAAPVTAVAFGPDGKMAVSGDAGSISGGGTLRCWSVTSGEESYSYRVPGGVLDAIVMDDGLRVASAGGDGILRIWGLPERSGIGRRVKPSEIGLPELDPLDMTLDSRHQDPNKVGDDRLDEVIGIGGAADDENQLPEPEYEGPRFGDDAPPPSSEDANSFTDQAPKLFGPQ